VPEAQIKAGSHNTPQQQTNWKKTGTKERRVDTVVVFT